MKLFEATVELTLFVVAEDAKAAREIARRHACEETDNADIDIVDANPKNIYSDWVDSIPYGKHQDKTVRQWVDLIACELGKCGYDRLGCDYIVPCEECPDLKPEPKNDPVS